MTQPGRPAGPTSETATVVLTAALELLLTEGAAALSAQRLHSVTGVSRSTIYRHWPTPHAVLAALIEVAPRPAVSLTGEARADLHAEVDALCDRLRDRPVGGFLHAIVAAAAWDSTMAELRRRYVEDLLSPFHAAASSAGLTGGAREDAVSAIVSPLLLDALLLDRPAARERAHRTVDALLTRIPS
ncbi:TetR/AcrR family transcriptional regulator C-terminal ligand-binding domain-containing protein [Streptomyces sp. NBC_00335]|uniref:TetR/AcrR family transcriptional regulator C-terminal ligand-binding domain-containing protein n=1 Tax=unclassified Streptomyces TaxID=2593676 RepID=UPI0022552226|nr:MULTISPECIES: TetR/AcrR family transcriptional regulator C-terminal ligand-binding domain-containing protein [unclassified Streptomyces]MCX5410191.1 TetR/AcrR family transcriptional regulator C-terminal ligand-binding domain-containing protein [Streptomyces sp. NBC_00086]